MELCTAVKGWGLTRLLESGYDFVFYLDPDCWVLEDPKQIIDLIEQEKSVLVVPHTTSPAQTNFLDGWPVRSAMFLFRS